MLDYFKKQPGYRWVLLAALLLVYPALTTLVYLTGGNTAWFSLAVIVPAITFLSVGSGAGNGLLVFTLLLFWVLGMREEELGARSAMLLHLPVTMLTWIFALIHRYRGNEEERAHSRTLSSLEERLALIREQYKTDLVVNVSNQKKFQKYSLLNRVSRVFGSQLQLDKLADKVIQEVQSMVGAERGCYHVLFGFQDSPGISRSLPAIEGEETSQDDQYTHYVGQHLTSLLVSDTNDDFRFQALGPDTLVRSLMLSPMLSEGHRVGLLRAESPFPDTFSKDDLRLFTIISDLAGVAAENAHLYQCAQELAITDGLTGLYLRRFFNQRFEEELERYREHGTPFSLMILDLDHFKRINDRLGHLAGDQILAQLGEALRAEARVADLICRFGGEEFALILPNTNLEGGLVMAERIRSRIAQREFHANSEILKITVSLGIGECPKNGQDMIELVRMTDEALYMAKRRGRNRIILAGSKE